MTTVATRTTLLRASPMIDAVPLSASAAVNKQMSAARSSWSVSDAQAVPDYIWKIQVF